MDRVHPDSTPMIGRSLDQRKDPFCPRDDDKNVLEAEVLILSATSALLIVLSLMYMTRYIICELVSYLCAHAMLLNWHKDNLSLLEGYD